jgi:hypothetical protein
MPQLDLARRSRTASASAFALAVTAVVLVGALSPASAAPAGPTAPPEPESEVFVLTGAGARRSAPVAARPGWTTAIDVADGSQGIGVSWAGDAEGAVSVRGRTDAGWGGWRHLDGDPDEGPDAAERTGAPLLWLGPDGVDEVEVRVDEGRLAGLQVQAVRVSVDQAAAAADAAPKAASADGRPSIVPRSAWTSKGWVASAGCTPGPVAHPSGIGFAVVHHTVNSNTYSAAEVPAMLSAIYAYDSGSLGWCDMAYHFIVDRFGRTWEGRSGGVANPIIGTHAKGFNYGSVGVALLGQHQPGASPGAVAPSAAALDAAGRVIGWKLALHGRSPSGTATTTSTGSTRYPAGQVVTLNRVAGHRDTNLTSCPGDLVHSQLAVIRAAAADHQSSMPAATGPLAPFRTPGTLVTQQYRDLLRRAPSQERYDHWTARVGSTVAPGSFIAGLVQSTDADALLHSTTRLYRAYFLRNPDHAGFAYWTGRRAQGTSLVQISNSFARSSEFVNRYGTLSDADFVRRVYQNVLGRAPDAGGQRYWTDRLRAGESRGVVMVSFSESSEYRRKTKAGNEVVALYETMLQRAVTASAYQTLVADLAAGRRTTAQVATSLFVSGSYAKRFARPS